jgi:hypothetical protein
MPGEGIGSLKSLNVFGPKRWLQSFSSSSGTLTMETALKGHFLTQIPHPVHRLSTITALLSSNRMASTRVRTIGQNRWQALSQFLGLHLSMSMTATLVICKSFQRIVLLGWL